MLSCVSVSGMCRLLVLCAHLAAGLPYRRADEPLTALFHINVLVSRRGEDVLAALKASLAESLPKLKNPNPETPQVAHHNELCVSATTSLMLLRICSKVWTVHCLTVNSLYKRKGNPCTE